MDGDEHTAYACAPLQFQMPLFMGSTPSLAHGGGAEVLPGMYTAHPWCDTDKYWYDAANPGAAKCYSLADFAADPPPPPPPPASPRQQHTPRPFEFTDELPPPPPPRPFEFADELPPPAAPSPPDACALALLPAFPAPLPALPTYALPPFPFDDPTAPLPPLPPTGLPLYSASGFDMLKVLSKVVTRANPKIMLGPVDMTCSFVVADVRRLDAPIVYASPTFSKLTGYAEAEVLGRNCRFLQAPSGHVARGEARRFTAPDAVRHLQKCLLQEKECQASLINYRKDGAAFINLVTVIPVPADDASDEITHHVGFQVDLAAQPNAVLQRLRDGSFIVNYSTAAVADGGVFGLPSPPRRAKGVSHEMAALLRQRRPWNAAVDTTKPARDTERAELHAMLLENTDDFIHVVSLKGSLLYVAPAVQRVLGYDAAELIGKSIADLCHPADVVPLMRELKDASAAPAGAAGAGPGAAVRPVGLLFRARHKGGTYVWLEARGRLHVEQGKGRKAVVLVGRRTGVPRLRWGAVRGGDAPCGLVARNGLVLAAGDAALVGRALPGLVVPPGEGRRVAEVLAGAGAAARTVRCVMRVRGGAGGVPVEVVFHAREREAAGAAGSVVFQLRVLDAGEGDDGAAGAGRADAEEDVLAELAPGWGTSWQYELTRLRIENGRMRAEAARLERVRRAQGPAAYARRHGGGEGAPPPPPVMASLGRPTPGEKRTWDGAAK